MKQLERPPTDLRILIALGCVALLILICLPIIGIGYTLKESARLARCSGRSPLDAGCAPSSLWTILSASKGSLSEPSNTTSSGGALGAEGTRCGGPQRLPCQPGLSCRKSEEGGYGTCIPSEVAQQYISSLLENQGCGRLIGGCSPGLVCRISPNAASGVCVEADATSAQIISLVLKGASFEQQQYMVAASTTIEVTVQTINATAVNISFLTISEDRSASIHRELVAKLTKGNAGVYTGTFVMPSGLDGRLEVAAGDEHGQVAALSVKLTSH